MKNSPKTKICKRCGGLGERPGMYGPRPCSTCNGFGSIFEEAPKRRRPNHYNIAADFEDIKKIAMWGTYGKNKPMSGKVKWVKLIDCETAHLKAIIDSCILSDDYRMIINSILKDRGILDSEEVLPNEEK
jgi:hypothetical protein